MNTRICSVMTAVTLLAFSSGCSGMKNFLLGRGAQCGLCNSPGGCLPQPQFGNTMQAPTPQPGCNCPTHAAPDAYASGLGCGVEGYGPVTSDPYLSSGQGMGQQVYPGTTYPSAPIQSDDFQSRRFDSDGNQILWEEPLPPGARGF